MDVSVDCALFADGERLKLLLIRQRTSESGPLSEADLQMALPGDFVEVDESLHHAAGRVLQELTGLDDVYLKQFHAFGDPNRVKGLKDQQWLRTFRAQPENRVMTVAYFGLVSLHDHIQGLRLLQERRIGLKWTNCRSWPLITMKSPNWHW